MHISALYSKPMQTWLDINYAKQVSPTTTFLFEQELEWERGLNKLIFYYFEPIISYKKNKNFSWGFGWRSAYAKRDNKIKFNQNRPYLWIKPSGTFFGLPWAYRAQFGLRFRHKGDEKNNHGYWRSSFWLKLLKKKPVSFTLRQDWFYNIHNTQNVDSLLSYFWVDIATHKNYYPYIYVCYFRDKTHKNRSWTDGTAIALGLNASF